MDDRISATSEETIALLSDRLNDLECSREWKLQELLDRIDAIESALEQERKRQQQLSRCQRSNRRMIEVVSVGLLSFLGFCLVILTGLQLNFGWGTFALPSGVLESGAIAASVSALSKYAIDKQREQSE